MTDHVSALLFCPTDQAIENLKKEGVVDNKMHKVVNTGDVMFDAALYYKKDMKKPDVELSDDFILTTYTGLKIQMIWSDFSQYLKLLILSRKTNRLSSPNIHGQRILSIQKNKKYAAIILN